MINLSKAPRLVATDLDGTLVRSDETVSPRSMSALKRLASSGVIVVGATGRGPRLLDLCRNDIPAADFLVLGQGGFVYEARYDDSTVEIFSRTVDGAVVLDALNRIEARTGSLRAMAEPADTSRHLSGDPIPSWPWNVPTIEVPRDAAFSGPMVKAYFVSDTLHGTELLDAATAAVDPDQVTVTESGVRGMLEVCPAGVNKGAGLQVVLDKFGIDWADVLAFGDATNDLPMLRSAGHAVVMPHAHPRVKAVADEIAPAGNDDDGVAQYIEDLLTLI